MRLPRLLLTVAAMWLACGTCGCGRDETRPVLVLAAASTADAVREVADAFGRETKVKVEVSAAGSNALAKQILAGAPADLFLSASREWADVVKQAGLAVESRDLLTNDLVLIVPRGNPAAVASPADLTGVTIRRVALAGAAVPAGKYAEQSLRMAGVYDALVATDRVARGEDVRQALAYVETGEAEAGVVYASDAAASDKVEIVYTFPADSHALIVYPLVLLKRGGGDGRAFYDFLQSDAAAAVFRERGFAAGAK